MRRYAMGNGLPMRQSPSGGEGGLGEDTLATTTADSSVVGFVVRRQKYVQGGNAEGMRAALKRCLSEL